jgi:hypothetical protein
MSEPFSSEGDSFRSRRAIFATAFPMFQTTSVAKEIKVLGIGNVRFSVNLRSGAERPTWLRGDALALLHSITNPFCELATVANCPLCARSGHSEF